MLLERDRPRADLWWSGESLYTSRLEAEGCFEALTTDCPAASSRRPDARGEGWIGFGARLRVLVYRPDSWPSALPAPRGLSDLTRPELKGRCILAQPWFGTSATHAAALLSMPGGRELLGGIHDNGAMLVAGNSQVVRAVAKRQALLGLTDSDDAVIAAREFPGLRFIIPDQAADDRGTIMTPSSAAVLAGAARAEHARAFVAWLAGPEAESLLASSRARHWPLARDATPPADLPALAGIRLQAVDLTRLAADWDRSLATLAEIFER